MNYYVDINGETKGPLTLLQLRSMWNTGMITGQTHYWQEGMTEWIPLELLQEMIERPPASAIPPITSPERGLTTPSRPPSSGGGKMIVVGCVGVVAVFIHLAIIYTISSSKEDSSGRGTVIAQSAWDSSVPQVKKYLHDNLKDPDSLQFIEWSRVERLPSGYAVRCKYRAKNSFGGYVVENRIFLMDEIGRVVGSVDR